jgi:hypothetical protein
LYAAKNLIEVVLVKSFLPPRLIRVGSERAIAAATEAERKKERVWDDGYGD